MRDEWMNEWKKKTCCGWRAEINKPLWKACQQEREEKRKVHERAGGENRGKWNYEMKYQGYTEEVINGEYSLFSEKEKMERHWSQPTRNPSNVAAWSRGGWNEKWNAGGPPVSLTHLKGMSAIPWQVPAVCVWNENYLYHYELVGSQNSQM